MNQKSKLKIGLMLNLNRSLKDWEINLFENLLNSKYCEIKLIISDNKKNGNNNFLCNLINKLFKGNFILSTILMFIKLVENKFNKKTRKENEIKILNSLKKIKILKPFYKKKKYIDIFSNQDYEKIKKYNLDLILRRDFRIIKGKILNATKHGIWSLHHGDNDFYRGLAPGFWEVYNNEPTTGVTLQTLNNTLDGGKILDKGYFGTKYFWKHNEDFIKEKSVVIILKNLKKLFYKRHTKDIKKSKNKNKVKYYKDPTSINLIIYILKKYPFFIIKKIFRNLLFLKFFTNKWKICEIPMQKLNNIDLKKISIFKSPIFEYWADPFFFKNKKKKYLFFENFEILKNKGKISFGEIKGKDIINIKDAINTSYHLSYPSIFKIKNNIFMIPESSKKNHVEIWISKKFPHKWRLFKKIFVNESWADINIFFDKNGDKWLFGNKSRDKYLDHNSELYIYKIMDDNFNKLEPHKLNPVIIDSRIARNAGKIFYNNRRQIIRPSQINIREKYGSGININIIKKLTLNDYKEQLIAKIEPDTNHDVEGVHHITTYKNKIYIDALFNF